jgi:hypothetical protein
MDDVVMLLKHSLFGSALLIKNAVNIVGFVLWDTELFGVW